MKKGGGQSIPETRKTSVGFTVGWCLAVFLAGGIGLFAGQSLSEKGALFFGSGSTERIGNWSYDPLIGSSEGGAHMRAASALTSIWAMTSSKAAYLITDQDSSGRTLDANCTYRVEGQDPDSLWWSITAYQDNYMIPNEAERYSFSATTVERDENNRWSFYVSPDASESPRLPTRPDGGKLELTMRIYKPSSMFRSSLSDLSVPVVEFVSC